MFSDHDTRWVVRKLTDSFSTSKASIAIRASVLPPSGTTQGHHRLSPQVVTYEFNGPLAFKESLLFRLFLPGKMGILHATWPEDSRKPVAAAFWTGFDQSLKDCGYQRNEVSLTNESKEVFQIVQPAVKSSQGFSFSCDAERLESDQAKQGQQVKNQSNKQGQELVRGGETSPLVNSSFSCIDTYSQTWLWIVLLQHLARRSLLLEGSNKRNKVTSSGLLSATPVAFMRWATPVSSSPWHRNLGTTHGLTP